MLRSKTKLLLPEELVGLGVVGLLLYHIHLHPEGEILDSVLEFLGEVNLEMLIEERASILLTQSLEGSPMLGLLSPLKISSPSSTRVSARSLPDRFTTIRLHL